jgi:hypothetical protein
MHPLAMVFAVIPITVLLTVSFFVLLAGEKAASNGLKKFAKVLAVLLWISSGLLVVGAAARVCCGPTMMCHRPLMHQGMGPMHGKHAMCPMCPRDVMKMQDGCCAKTNK